MGWLARRYSVLIERHDFVLPLDDGQVAIGFFTPRFVSAASPREAAERALALLASDPRYKARIASASRPPSLRVDEVTAVGFFTGRLRPIPGLAFYPAPS